MNLPCIYFRSLALPCKGSSEKTGPNRRVPRVMDFTSKNEKRATSGESGSTMSDLSFGQINLLHCKKATYTYCCDLKINRTDISLIQEPWIRGSKIHGFGQLHDRLFYCRTGRPRAAIHVSKNLNAMQLNQFTNDDLVAVRICRDANDGGDFTVVSVYMPYDPGVPPPGPTLDKVVQFCKDEQIPLIIGSDSNSHHTIWGSTNVNQRGEELVQYLLSTDLLVLNKGRKPTFVNAIRKEAIDITLASCDVSEKIHSWRVTDQETYSDHKLIKFCLKGQFPQREPYRNPKRTNWNLYRAELSKNLMDLDFQDSYYTKEALDKANEELTSAIMKAYEAACPLTVPKPLYKRSLWSNDLEEMKRKLRKAWNRAGKKCKEQEENKAKFRQLLKEYNRAQLDLKEKSKAKFFEEANSIPAYARIHKLLAKDPTVQVGTLLKPDGSYTTNSEETVMHLLETHFPGAIQPQDNGSAEPDFIPSRKDWKLAEKLTKRGKIKCAIFKFHSFKSAGPDKVFPALLKEGIYQLVERMGSIFKSSIALGHVPKLWEEVRVAFIPKPGRSTHCEAKDFRPISLASFLLKAVERLLDFYIRGEVLKRFPLHANQHAYQMGKSTNTALHQLTHKIEHMLNNGKIALGCFMDIEGAFDNTKFEVITKAAVDRQMESTAVRWIVRMLSGRKVVASVCGTSTKLGVTRGCPQGGILSPILWCMVIDSLLVRLNNAGIFTQGYSDDVSSLVCGDFESTLGDRMRTAIKIVEDWCGEKGLKVNPIKTKVILFSKRKGEKDKALGRLKLFGKELSLTASAKYLGVIFDCKMTWIAHFEDKYNKVLGIFWMCRNAFGRTWGLSPKAIWWIYTAVVRPILCHGCVVWWPRVNVQVAKKRADKLQRLACLCITGVKNSTALMALEALLALPPLDLYIKATAFNVYMNVKCNGWWNSLSESGHVVISKLIVDERLDMPSDQIRAELMIDDRFECIVPSREDWLGDMKIFPPREGIICYTDGSKQEILSGSGIFCVSPQIKGSFPTGTYATVFQTELFAMIEICESESIKGASGKSIYICSDSESAIKAVRFNVVTSGIVKDCKTRLNELGLLNNVTLLWVPSHAGIAGNENADRLANIGAKRVFHGPEPCFGIPKQVRKGIVKEWLESEHLSAWNEYDGGRHTKIFCRVPSDKVRFELLNLGRPNIKRVVESITNHCGLNKHLYDINCCDNPACLCGHGDETGVHIISNCPRYRFFRQRILGKPELNRSDLELHSLGIEKLAVFLKCTKRLP